MKAQRCSNGISNINHRMASETRGGSSERPARPTISRKSGMSAVTTLLGDCRQVLKTLAANSVQCIITSPPYYGLRDYGTASWSGGDPDCDHLQGDLVSSKSTLRNDGREHIGPYSSEKAVATGMPYKENCGKCGSVRKDKQIGLEQTPELYTAALVEVFREARRVLRDDGTLWLNLGDSYSKPGKWGGGKNYAGKQPRTIAAGYRDIKTNCGIPGKNLIGIPWRVAFALQADGWIVRSEVIWSKTNGLPESVQDRPSKTHETIFLLAKSPKYFYDGFAVAEPTAPTTNERLLRGVSVHNKNTDGAPGQSTHSINLPRENKNALASTTFKRNGTKGTENLLPGQTDTQHRPDRPDTLPQETRNRRSVWQVATQSYKDAHYAVFPEKLIEPCILAGTSQGGACPACGTPWKRRVKKGAEFIQGCTCEAGPPVPCKVLDPFGGSGTVGRIAVRFGRDALLIELNPAYIEQIDKRTDKVQTRLF